MASTEHPTRRRPTRAQAEEALAALRQARGRGHQQNCPCQSRNRRGCVELRRICLDGGLWREVAELGGEAAAPRAARSGS